MTPLTEAQAERLLREARGTHGELCWGKTCDLVKRIDAFLAQQEGT